MPDVSGNNTWLGGLGDALGTNSGFRAQPLPINSTTGNWGGAYTDASGQNHTGVSDVGLDQARTGYGGQAAGDYANQLAARQGQQGLAGLLQQQAAGQGPSAAMGILQQGSNQAGINALSAARMAQGNPAQQAAAINAASNSGAQATQQAGGMAAQVRSQEQLAAQQGLAALYGQQRGQDIQAQGLGQQGELGYLSAAMAAQQAQQQAALARAGLNSQNYNAAQGINAGTASANAQNNSDMLSGLAGGAAKGAAAAMMSDRRVKKNIKSGRDDADEFLEALAPKTYRYKSRDLEPRSKGNGESYLGIIAQSLEKTRAGKQMIRETPAGKAVELAPLVSGLAAAVGRLNEKVK